MVEKRARALTIAAVLLAACGKSTHDVPSGAIDAGAGGMLSSGGVTSTGGNSGTGGASSAAGGRSEAGGTSGTGGSSLEAGAGSPPSSAGSSGAAGSPPSEGGAAGVPGVPDPEPFAGTPEEYWRQIERLRRDRWEECLGVRADYDITGYDILPIDYFVERFAEANSRTFRRGLESGRQRFDAEGAGACLARLGTESCDELRRDVAFGDECYLEWFVEGTVATGEFCEHWADCRASDDVCHRAELACSSGKCTPGAQPGESCDFIWCVDGARCPDAEPYICQASELSKEGELCSPNECEPGLFCSRGRRCREYALPIACTTTTDCPRQQACLIEPGTSQGICGPGRAVGEPCSTPGEDECTRAAACRGSVCTDVWVPEGAMCRNSGSNGGLVCIESRCHVMDQMTQEGVCGPYPGVGEECTVGGCGPGFECTVDGCAMLPFCQRESCGDGTYCTDSGCVPEKVSGDACAAPNECGFAMACVGGVCQACE